MAVTQCAKTALATMVRMDQLQGFQPSVKEEMASIVGMRMVATMVAGWPGNGDRATMVENGGDGGEMERRTRGG